jgi:hypothetical protein
VLLLLLDKCWSTAAVTTPCKKELQLSMAPGPNITAGALEAVLLLLPVAVVVDCASYGSAATSPARTMTRGAAAAAAAAAADFDCCCRRLLASQLLVLVLVLLLLLQQQLLVLAVYTVLPAGSRRTNSCPHTAAPSAGGSLQTAAATQWC